MPKQQEKPQNNLREKSQREQEKQKLQNQPSSSKCVFDYFISLFKECKEKKIDLNFNNYNYDDYNYLYNYDLDDYYLYDLLYDDDDLNAFENWKELSEDRR